MSFFNCLVCLDWFDVWLGVVVAAAATFFVHLVPCVDERLLCCSVLC